MLIQRKVPLAIGLEITDLTLCSTFLGVLRVSNMGPSLTQMTSHNPNPNKGIEGGEGGEGGGGGRRMRRTRWRGGEGDMEG